MLNRRILRIKAFKAVYSYAENPTMDLKTVEAQLERSCEATRNLYLFLLASVGPITREASARIEAARSKFNPTEEELNPNLKFVNNLVAPALENDPDLTKILSRKHFSWDQYDMCIRHIYESIRSRDYFNAYLADPETSFAKDAELWADIFEFEFADNAEVEAILEDLSIWWNDDLEYALSWCCRTMESLGKGARWSLPPLYMSEINPVGKDSDKAFVTGIVRSAVRSYEKSVADIAGLTPKWDSNRICTTDLALIVSALAEHASFPNIPSKVTINEFVEISKFYSTPDSRAFVNGLLDKLINKNNI